MASAFVHLSRALLLWAFFQWYTVQSHKILLLPMFGNSHYFVMRKIAGELAQRDNEVNDLKPMQSVCSSEREKGVSIPKRLFLFIVLRARTKKEIPF